MPFRRMTVAVAVLCLIPVWLCCSGSKDPSAPEGANSGQQPGNQRVPNYQQTAQQGQAASGGLAPEPDAQAALPADAGASPPAQDCCQAHETPGCGQPDIEACVCNGDAKCCEQQWDAFCAMLVGQIPCGTCPDDPPPPEDPPPEDPPPEDPPPEDPPPADPPPEDPPPEDPPAEQTGCCVSHTTPGCDDDGIEACVCGLEPSCCQEDWDMFCVILVSSPRGAEPACGSCN